MSSPKLALVLASPFLLSALNAQTPAHEINSGRLCRAGESVLFACRIGSKEVAVCGNPDGKGAQYRFGRPGKIELRYPARRGMGGISYARTAYSGGGEAQLRFVNRGYEYVVFSRVIRTRFDGQGNDPIFPAGVAVRKGTGAFRVLNCNDGFDASVDLGLAERLLPEGEFVELP